MFFVVFFDVYKKKIFQNTYLKTRKGGMQEEWILKIKMIYFIQSETIPSWMFILWISQMMALLDKHQAHAVRPIILRIATEYPQVSGSCSVWWSVVLAIIMILTEDRIIEKYCSEHHICSYINIGETYSPVLSKGFFLVVKVADIIINLKLFFEMLII